MKNIILLVLSVLVGSTAFAFEAEDISRCGSLLAHDSEREGGCLSYFSGFPYEGVNGRAVVRHYPNTAGLRKFSNVVYIIAPFEMSIAGLEETIHATAAAESEAYFQRILDAAGPDGSVVGSPMVDKVLRDQGYDIVIIGYPFELNDDYLQRKAGAMASAIRNIQVFRHNSHISWLDDNNPSVENKTDTVIGLSMGGVVARYGLALAESRSIRLGIEQFISIDSPHTGSNVPLALQNTLAFLKAGAGRVKKANTNWLTRFVAWTGVRLDAIDVTGIYIDVVNEIFNTNIDKIRYLDLDKGLRQLAQAEREASAMMTGLNTIAVKQMLINHYKSPETDPLRSALLSELDDLGMPTATLNVAIVNGSLNGDRLVQDNGGVYFNSRTNTYKSSRWTLNARADDWDRNLYGKLRYPKQEGIKVDIEYYRKSYYSNGYRNVDQGVCSTTNLPASFITGLTTASDWSWSEIPALDESSCFIPLRSALAIPGDDYLSPVDIDDSPFDIVIGNDNVEPHMNVLPYANQILSMVLSQDIDRDGLSDRREVELGTDPLKRDTDGDGFSDSEEISQGYDPLDASSNPGVLAIQIHTFSFEGESDYYGDDAYIWASYSSNAEKCEFKYNNEVRINLPPSASHKKLGSFGLDDDYRRLKGTLTCSTGKTSVSRSVYPSNWEIDT